MTFFDFLDNEYKRLAFEMRETFDNVKKCEAQVTQKLVEFNRKWIRFLAYFKFIFKYFKCKLLNKFPETVDLQALLKEKDPPPAA